MSIVSSASKSSFFVFTSKNQRNGTIFSCNLYIKLVQDGANVNSFFSDMLMETYVLLEMSLTSYEFHTVCKFADGLERIGCKLKDLYYLFIMPITQIF